MVGSVPALPGATHTLLTQSHRAGQVVQRWKAVQMENETTGPRLSQLPPAILLSAVSLVGRAASPILPSVSGDDLVDILWESEFTRP